MYICIYSVIITHCTFILVSSSMPSFPAKKISLKLNPAANATDKFPDTGSWLKKSFQEHENNC